MIGRALTTSFLADGHRVWWLTRDPKRADPPKGVTVVAWDGFTNTEWGELINQIDVVINLVGERLSRWPWTRRQKERIWDSRVKGGNALLEAIREASSRPKVLLQASGVNYYGPRGKTPVSEKDEAGNDFLGKLSQAWETSTEEVERLGVRRVIIRSAIVLSAQEGILPIMLFPVKWMVGGPIGNGRQGLPWIHLQDEVRAIKFLLENNNASGAFNLSAPNPISNSEFLRTTAKVIHRPFWLPVPALALRLMLGGLATLVLEGMYVQPGRLQQMGFIFRFEKIEDALKDLLS